MTRNLIVPIAVLSLATLVCAQAPSTRLPAQRDLSAAQHHVQTSRAPEPAVGPSTITCAASYSSGSGDARVTYCVTVNGNITELSRAGKEMINVGTVDEGYGICDFTSNTHYFDYGWTDSGNWNPSTLTFPNANTAVSTRITSDGIWRITNTITKVPATATSVGQVKVNMAIKNLTGIARSIFLLRHADVDADGDITNNDFDWEINTASGSYVVAGTETFGYGLQLLNNSFNIPTGEHNEYALNDCCAPDPCNVFTNISTQPFHGDGSVMSLYGLSVPSLGTKSVQVTYQPI